MIYNVGGNYKEECVELPPGASQDFVSGAGGATTVLLQPGEFALFDVNIVHGSPPNKSGPDERRAGLGIRCESGNPTSLFDSIILRRALCCIRNK